jgi:hypothetical protein
MLRAFHCEPEESNPGGEADFSTLLKSSDVNRKKVIRAAKPTFQLC